MSKLEKLIKELCPNGVEYKKTDEVCSEKFWLMPSTPNYIESGIPYITSKNVRDNTIDFENVNYISKKDYEAISKNRTINKGDLLITMIGTIGEAAFVKHDIDFYGQNMYLLRLDISIINPMYYYYYLTSPQIKERLISKKNPSSQGYIKAGSIDNLLIPIPPLSVQAEIVRILDNFTELKTELTAELTARKKQYEFYHNLLMDFSNTKVKFLPVGELFEIKNGLNKEKAAFGMGHPIINFTDVYNNRCLTHDSFKGLVNVTNNEIERFSARKGDIFFTRTSETKEDIGMSSALIDDVPNCVFSGFILRARPTTNLLLPKFCAYYFSTHIVRNTIVKYAAFTTRATTTGPKLSKIMVPILTLAEQQRIVDILDRFDTLCNDISSGLPAEIEARQKQYEYYRDKLLDFKNIDSSSTRAKA